MASTEFQCIILVILKSLCDERADFHGMKTEKKQVHIWMSLKIASTESTSDPRNL